MGSINFRYLTVFAVGLGLFAALPTRGDGPYLPKTGPSPLRFSLAMANVASFTLPAVLLNKPLATNSVEVAGAKTNSATPITAVAQSPSTPAPTTASSPSDSQDNTLTPVPTTPAASDLLVVSPQMLTEFFKPGPGGSNVTVVPLVVPTPVGFTPPADKPSSQAIYKSP